jgi:plasmid stability protein
VKKNETYTRATVYFVPEIHKALRLRAAESGASVSQLVNEALQQALADDAADLDAFVLQKNERHVSFEHFISELRRRGRI